jgi:hypothetical protein
MIACLCCPAGLLLPIGDRSTQARRRLTKQSLQGKRRLRVPLRTNSSIPTYHRDDGEDCQGYQNRAFENIKASLNAALYARQVAQFIWHLVEAQGCRRQAAYRAALTKFTTSASFAEKAYAFWEPIFKPVGPHVKMLPRISDPEM